jgi:hypothetical protein
MDLIIATGVFALVLAVTLVLVTGKRDDTARAADLLVDVTRTPTDTVGWLDSHRGASAAGARD